MNRNMRKCFFTSLHVHVRRMEEGLALTRLSPGFPNPTLCEGERGHPGFPGIYHT